MGESENIASRLRRLIDATHDGKVHRAAKATGLSHVTLGRIVKGNVKNPRAEALSRIADAYQTSIDWLLHGRGEEPQALTGKLVSGEAERLNRAIEFGDVVRKPTPRAYEYVLMIARLELSNEASGILRSLPVHVSQIIVAIPFPISLTQVLALDEAREASYDSWYKLVAAVVESIGREAFRALVEANLPTLRSYLPPEITDEQFFAYEHAQRELNSPAKPMRRRPTSKKRI